MAFDKVLQPFICYLSIFKSPRQQTNALREHHSCSSTNLDWSSFHRTVSQGQVKQTALLRLLRTPQQYSFIADWTLIAADFALQAPGLVLSTLISIASVCKSWRNLVFFLFLRVPMSTSFWQRVFASDSFVLQPELANAK